MRYLPLGKGQTRIPVIGQGCGGGTLRDDGELEARASALRLGIDCGMTLLDTAEAYHEGRSERAVAKATAGQRDKVFIATKVSPNHLDSRNLHLAAEASLRRLNTDYIDLYQIHWSNPRIPIQETMAAMTALVDAGKVRHVGVCNFSAKELREAQAAFHPLELVTLQAEYNLFDRSAEQGLLPHWLQPNRAFLAYSPLEQGSITGSGGTRSKLDEIAERYNATASQIALAWLITHRGVIPIPKAAQPDHIRRNASAADLEVTQSDLARIDATFSPRPLSVPVDAIRVATDGLDNRAVYQTLDEALENQLGMVPSPKELADDIRSGEFLKPVRVRPARKPDGKHLYDLIEGRLRYWAWVIAFNGERPIDVLLRDA